jgi:hypothetical protein
MDWVFSRFDTGQCQGMRPVQYLRNPLRYVQHPGYPSPPVFLHVIQRIGVARDYRRFGQPYGTLLMDWHCSRVSPRGYSQSCLCEMQVRHRSVRVTRVPAPLSHPHHASRG